jgi:hypothetical protein
MVHQGGGSEQERSVGIVHKFDKRYPFYESEKERLDQKMRRDSLRERGDPEV